MSIPIRIELPAPKKSRQRDWFLRDLETIRVLWPEAVIDVLSDSFAIYLESQNQAQALVDQFGGIMMWGVKFSHHTPMEFYSRENQIKAFVGQHQLPDKSLIYRIWKPDGSWGVTGTSVFYINDPKLTMLLKLSIT